MLLLTLGTLAAPFPRDFCMGFVATLACGISTVLAGCLTSVHFQLKSTLFGQKGTLT